MSTSQSLSRLLSSVTNFSATNPSLHSTRSQPLSRSVSDCVTRFLCSSTQHAPSHRDKPLKEQADAPKQNLPLDDKQSQEDKVGGDEDGGQVNKETGEVGGPKGPEPTRYGDWERNGRCYDF